jgi:hypothetical protein
MAMASPKEQLSQILALLGENSKGINELKSSMSEMRALRSEINVWKPEVDNRVHELEHIVVDLGAQMDRALEMLLPQAGVVPEIPPGVVTIVDSSASTLVGKIPASPTMKVSGSALLEPTPPEATSGSLDHGKSLSYRGASFGVVYTAAPIPALVTGADNPPKPSTALLKSSYYVHRGRLACLPVNPALSNFEFPRFDGSNPRMWITNGETFFGVYDTDPNKWVRLVLMHLTGSAALWFQTMQTTINAMN